MKETRSMRRKSILVHVSLDVVDCFTPRIPGTRMRGEDAATPRICVSDSLLRAINAAPQLADALTVLADYQIPAVLHAYYFHPEGQEVIEWWNLAGRVPDVNSTHESWITSTCSFSRRDYLIKEMRTDKETNRNKVLSAKFVRIRDTDNWGILAFRLCADPESAIRIAEGLQKIGVSYARLFIPPLIPQFEAELKRMNE